MKNTKSSNSLYCFPPGILTDHSNKSLVNFRQGKTRASHHNNLGSFHNARGKLRVLEEDLAELQHKVKQSQITNKELRLGVKFVRETMMDRSIGEIESDLQNKVKQLKKQVMIGVRSDMLKFNSLQQVVDALGKNHREIVYKMECIEERIRVLEDAMGDNHNLRSKFPQ